MNNGETGSELDKLSTSEVNQLISESEDSSVFPIYLDNSFNKRKNKLSF